MRKHSKNVTKIPMLVLVLFIILIIFLFKVKYFLFFSFLDLSNCFENSPKLEILPALSVQRKPIGRPLILTCQPNVEQKELISDLRWRDSSNNTILAKP